jgi:hypothetical protein
LEEDFQTSYPADACRQHVEDSAAPYAAYLSATEPEIFENICGLAKGAAISLNAATYLQYRREILQAMHKQAIPECSLFAMRQSPAGFVLGQTIDLKSFFRKFGVLVRTLAHGDRPVSLHYSFPGLLGYAGMNSAGLCVGINMVQSAGWKIALSPYLLVQKILQSRSAADACAMLKAIDVSSSRCITFGDATNLYCAELHPDLRHVEHAETVVHTNHYIFDALRPLDKSNVLARKQSRLRLERLASLRAAMASPSAAAVMRVFADHEGYPNSICYHSDGQPHRLDTVAAICMFAATREFVTLSGHPCEGQFERFQCV